jgi:hypothetical protein
MNGLRLASNQIVSKRMVVFLLAKENHVGVGFQVYKQ